jgi:hypothetical protein
VADTCPPECKVKINGIKQDITDLKATDQKQWEVFDQKILDVGNATMDRVKTKTLIALFGVVVIVFLAIMGMTFRTLSSGQDKALIKLDHIDDRHQKQMVKIEREVVRLGTLVEERHREPTN